METKMKTKIAKKKTTKNASPKGIPVTTIKARIAKLEMRIAKSNARAKKILEKNKTRTQKIADLKKRLSSL
jgi:hypothetical protein